MDNFFYGLSGWTIALSLLALMLLAMEAGCRAGLRGQARSTNDSRAQISTVQTSLLGILALLLGFTFSIALDRYNGRSLAVVNEANAIGTAFLLFWLFQFAFADICATIRKAVVDVVVNPARRPRDPGAGTERPALGEPGSYRAEAR